jgi:hypothetical protein
MIVMRKNTFTAAIMVLILSTLPLAEAQPTPPNVSTLGPVIIHSAGDSATNVKILSPQNHSQSNSPIQLNFTVQAVGMFGQFGNIGYSLDNGIINSVTSFVNKSVEFAGPAWYWNRTIVFGSVVLPQLSDGFHNVTVYYGWQYLGINNPSSERFEVNAYETVDFSVGNSNALPTHTNPPPSTTSCPSPTPVITSTLSPSTSPPPPTSPLPSPSITPSSSPTQQPTLSPSPTLDNIQAENFTSTIIALSIIAIAVVVGVLVYGKKRRR